MAEGFNRAVRGGSLGRSGRARRGSTMEARRDPPPHDYFLAVGMAAAALRREAGNVEPARTSDEFWINFIDY
jgi:hypothetical protein